ncbi:MAG: polyketide synthase, partial [Deltaproteobacteria bacterium]|nr:polyketide synthase [Deltaproteobacteria bacterium]
MHRKVAIIGYSFRLPGGDRESLWQNLCSGRDLITEVYPSRWEKDSFYHPSKGHPGSSYTFAAGSIGDVAGFDAAFFGISPREAACMDPQQRLLLELTWEAMESAGLPPCSLRGSPCGVFIGVSSTDYASRFAHDLAAVDATTATGTTSSLVANRISYLFDLHGPSMAIDTACCSSL